MMLVMPCCYQGLPLDLSQVVRSCVVISVDNEMLRFEVHLDYLPSSV